MLVGTWKKLLKGRRHRIQVQPRGSLQGVKSNLQAGSLHYRTSRTSMCKYLEAFVVLIIVIPLSLGYQQNLFLIQGSMWDLGKDCVTLFRAVVRDTPFCVPDTL